MKIEIHHYYHCEELEELYSYLEDELVEINEKVDKILGREEQIMATAQELLAKVEEQTTIVAGINVLIADLKEDIANIPGIPPETQAAIDAAFAKVTENSDALAVNLVTNTPVE